MDLGDTFIGDAKASCIIAVMITIVAYVIGSLYYYISGSRGSVSWTFLLILFVVAFAILLYAARYVDEETKAEKALSRRKASQIQENEAAKAKEREHKIEEYKSLYDDCTKVIPNPSDPNSDLIRVYEKSSVILIKDMKYGFDEIIGWDLIDNGKVIKGELSSTTSTNNVNAIGRAVVGAALGGIAGAVIGGTTAKQTTEYKQGEDKTIHDYTLNINVNRLSEPLVKLYVGKNEDLALEAAALINIIVLRNKDGYDKLL